MKRLHFEVNWHFMRIRKICAAVSMVLVLGSVVLLFTNGLQYGLDFIGGNLLEISSDSPPQAVRDVLKTAGFTEAKVQQFGDKQTLLIRLPGGEQQGSTANTVVTALNSAGITFELLRQEYVGGQVGEELRDQGGLALLLALALVLIYVSFRFQFKFAIGAVIALVHDVVLTLGLFALLQITFDLTVLAAILAIIGYSLNDSIVVADRIRESFIDAKYADKIELIDEALSKIFGRTVNTSLTTLLVLLALAFFGGEGLLPFAIALICGVVVGTYSSLYILCNVLIWQNIDKKDLVPEELEQFQREQQ